MAAKPVTTSEEATMPSLKFECDHGEEFTAHQHCAECSEETNEHCLSAIKPASTRQVP